MSSVYLMNISTMKLQITHLWAPWSITGLATISRILCRRRSLTALLEFFLKTSLVLDITLSTLVHLLGYL